MNENPLMLNRKFWEDVKKAFTSKDSIKELEKVIDEGFSDLAKHFDSNFGGVSTPQPEKENECICPDCNCSNPTDAKYCNQCGDMLMPKKITWPLDEQPPWNEINDLLAEYGLKFAVAHIFGHQSYYNLQLFEDRPTETE